MLWDCVFPLFVFSRCLLTPCSTSTITELLAVASVSAFLSLSFSSDVSGLRYPADNQQALQASEVLGGEGQNLLPTGSDSSLNLTPKLLLACVSLSLCICLMYHENSFVVLSSLSIWQITVETASWRCEDPDVILTVDQMSMFAV